MKWELIIISFSEFDLLYLIACLFFYKWLKQAFQKVWQKSVTESTDEVIELILFKSYLFTFLSQLIIVDWNLSGFNIISFILNQSMADLLSFSNNVMSSTLFVAVYHCLKNEVFHDGFLHFLCSACCIIICKICDKHL